MSRPLENHQPLHRPEDCRIDRLVDGELPDDERRELLLRLETEPEGWRRCALAFLEAQSWRETFAASPLAVRVAPPPTMLQAGLSNGRRRWRSVAALTALAASLAATFALGWALHAGPRMGGAPASSAGVETGAPSETSRPAPVDVATREPLPAGQDEAPDPLEPVVKQWQQRGYLAERQKRLVSVELKDGRKIEVPVQEVRLQYAGGRTY